MPARRSGVRLLYASSAAVYGGSAAFREERRVRAAAQRLRLLEAAVRQRRAAHAAERPPPQVAGFRYFNVYGPHEQHKGRMASVAFHHFNQLRERGPGQAVRPVRRLRRRRAGARFRLRRRRRRRQPVVPRPSARRAASSTSAAAGPSRSTTSPRRSSTPRARDARRGAARRSPRWSTPALVEYIDFPAALVGKYQCFTEADLGRLRAAGCDHAFADVASGVARYAECAAGAGPLSPARVNPHGAGNRYGWAPRVAEARPSRASERRPVHSTHRGGSSMFKKFIAALAALLAATAFAAVDANKASPGRTRSDQGHRPGDLDADHQRAQEGRLQGLERPRHARQGRRRPQRGQVLRRRPDGQRPGLRRCAREGGARQGDDERQGRVGATKAVEATKDTASKAGTAVKTGAEKAASGVKGGAKVVKERRRSSRRTRPRRTSPTPRPSAPRRRRRRRRRRPPAAAPRRSKTRRFRRRASPPRFARSRSRFHGRAVSGRVALGAATSLPVEEGAHLVGSRHVSRDAERDQLARVGRLEQQVAGERGAARVVALARHAEAAEHRADRQRQARQVARGDVVEPLARRDDQHLDRLQRSSRRARSAAAAPAWR